jgi:hypothetical protein
MQPRCTPPALITVVEDGAAGGPAVRATDAAARVPFVIKFNSALEIAIKSAVSRDGLPSVSAALAECILFMRFSLVTAVQRLRGPVRAVRWLWGGVFPESLFRYLNYMSENYPSRACLVLKPT